MRLLRLIILLNFIPIPSSLAEYRAYELAIENFDDGSLRKVITTLDHIQYSTYYPLKENEKVSYLKSWMCWGTSDYERDICPAPETKESERVPANQ
ncbi:MAG: hypothetical protein H6625_07080 [Bdellovibrionaceae bacterium]|nr:hypothetical protein [Pseudobdellovibrionaceae bacterium]